jgi:hypothetical protein
MRVLWRCPVTTNTLAPCHICGERPRVIGDARGLLGDNAWRVTCHPSTAIYPTRAEAIAAWNDDARAREVLRAVETIGGTLQNLYALRHPDGDGWTVGARGDAREAFRAKTLADALRALAGEVER